MNAFPAPHLGHNRIYRGFVTLKSAAFRLRRLSIAALRGSDCDAGHGAGLCRPRVWLRTA